MKKNYLIVFSIITVVSLVIYHYFLLKKTTEDKNALPVNIQSIKEKTGRYSINAEYPTFNNAPKEFNLKIQNDINTKIKSFKDDITENQKVRTDTTYSFNLWWEPKQLNNHYLSFIVRSESFTGGANMNTDIFTYNYDLQTKKEVKLADLLGTQNYLNSLSSYIKSDLISQFKSISAPTNLINEGASPKEENFKNFVFNDFVIDFYFPKYQVVAGVYGEQHVVLPKNVTLKDN